MGSRTVRYGTREAMHGGVERLSGEGWILAGLRKLPGGALEATFSAGQSMAAPPGRRADDPGGGPVGRRAHSGRVG